MPGVKGGKVNIWDDIETKNYKEVIRKNIYYGIMPMAERDLSKYKKIFPCSH